MRKVVLDATGDTTEYRNRVRRLYPGVLISQITSVILGTVNTIMSGNISNAVLSGVGNADVVILVVVSLLDGFCIGGTVLVAQALGRQENKEASRAARSSLLPGLLVSSLLAVVLCLLRGPLIRLLFPVVEDTIFTASVDYLRYALYSIPFAYLFTQISGFFRSAGDSVTPMIAGVIVNVANIVLGAQLILGAFGGRGLGAVGAGATLLIARIIGALFLFIATFIRHKVSFLHIRNVGFQRAVFRRVIRLGLPSAAESGVFYVSRLVLQMLVARMGTDANAAHQVFNSLTSIYSLPVDAYSIVVPPIMANYAGTGSMEACKGFAAYCLRSSHKLSLCMSGVIAVSCWFLTRLYTPAPTTALTASFMLLALVYTMSIWPWTWLLPSCFKGVGNVRVSSGVSVVCSWLIRVGVALLLYRLAPVGVYAVPIAVALDCSVRALIFYPYYRKGRWLGSE